MEKLVRYRKAFYEKENDLQHCNKKRERIFPQHSKSMNFQKNYQTLPTTVTVRPARKERLKTNTSIYCELYADQLLSLPEYHLKQQDFLSKHSIDATLRARMLDWMVEVTSSYKFSHKTYFDGVSLMDRYFEAEHESLSPAKLHLIGVQCMLIASKMEEVFPLKIKTVYQKIAHKKIPLTDLVHTEEKIMRTLDYKLNSWSFFDLAMLKIAVYGKQSEEERNILRPIDAIGSLDEVQQKQLTNLEELCSYLSKFVLYDYAFYIDNSTLLLAESLVKACFEIASILPPRDFFSSSLILVELCKQRIFKNIKQYQNRFGGLNNIFKFTRSEVVAQVEQFMD